MPTTLVISAVELTCYKCGVPFTVPMHWRDTRMEDKETFWCPNGHPQAFVDSPILRENRDLKAKLAREEQTRRGLETRVAGLRSQNGKLTAQVKRATAGVCPYCNRTFQNVARHMHTKHPEDAPKPSGELP